MSGLRRFCVDFWWGFTHPGMALRQELGRRVNPAGYDRRQSLRRSVNSTGGEGDSTGAVGPIGRVEA